METGWKHHSHEAQREFERLRRSTAAATGSQAEAQPSTVGAPSGAGPTLANKLDVVVTSPDNTIEIRRWSSSNRLVYAIERRLQLRHENVPIPTAPGLDRYDDVRAIDFRSGSNVDVQMWREEDGHIVVEISSTATGGGGGSSSWFLAAGNGASTEISDQETVTFVGTGTAAVTRTGNTIFINVPANAYSWKASDGGLADTIATGETVTWKGAPGGGISVIYTAATNTFNFTNVSYWRMIPDTGFHVQISHDDTLFVQGINGVQTSSTVPFPKELVIDRPLQLKMNGASVGAADTTSIDFFNNAATKPASYTSQVYFDVTDLQTGNINYGQRKIEAWFADGTYQWNLLGSHGPDLTFINDQWLEITGSEGVKITTVDNGKDGSANNPWQVIVERPLTIEEQGFAVGLPNTLYINFDSQGQLTQDVPVHFDVTDNAAGRRSIRAWVPAGGGSYTWNISANGGAPENVGTGKTVDFSSADNTVTITRTNEDLDFSRPLTIEDDNVAIGGVDTKVINFDSQGSTSTGQAVNFQVVDDGTGQRSVRGWVPASAGTYEWTASDGTNTETVDNTDTIKWVGGNNITVTLDTATKTFTINAAAYPTHTWFIAANGTAGSSAITNGETVTFIGQGGIVVTRQGDNIIISADTEDPANPGSSQQKRRLTGEIVFAAGQTDIYGNPPAYFYGVRRYVDITHNWALSNMNNFHLELVDKHLLSDGTLGHSRNTNVFPASLAVTLPSVLQPTRYRNIPHWAAIDRDTIRVWATMTEEDTTDMVFRYVLTEE